MTEPQFCHVVDALAYENECSFLCNSNLNVIGSSAFRPAEIYNYISTCCDTFILKTYLWSHCHSTKARIHALFNLSKSSLSLRNFNNMVLEIKYTYPRYWMQSSVFVVFVHFLFEGTFWWWGSSFIFGRDIPNSGTPRLKSSHYPLQQALVIICDRNCNFLSFYVKLNMKTKPNTQTPKISSVYCFLRRNIYLQLLPLETVFSMIALFLLLSHLQKCCVRVGSMLYFSSRDVVFNFNSILLRARSQCLHLLYVGFYKGFSRILT